VKIKSTPTQTTAFQPCSVRIKMLFYFGLISILRFYQRLAKQTSTWNVVVGRYQSIQFITVFQKNKLVFL
jgi:hypothetical protein